MDRKALIVGVDEYPDPISTLKGCVNDAKRLTGILERNHDRARNFECLTRTAGTDAVTRRSLYEDIQTLFQPGPHFALFHFSGHGTINNLGGFLVTQDAQDYSDGVRMADIIKMANQSEIDEVLILLDCCHSGQLGNLPDKDNTAELREGVSVLTASRDSEIAMEDEDSEAGVFTSLMAAALEGGAADILGRVTIGSLYAYVDQALGAWDAQRPLFKSHVSHFNEIRRCEPSIDLDVMLKLPEYFQKSHSTLALDKSYEPTESPKNAEHESMFADLQSLRAARLVEPLSEAHLYYEAMNSGGCRLTRLGQHYWKLVSGGHI